LSPTLSPTLSPHFIDLEIARIDKVSDKVGDKVPEFLIIGRFNFVAASHGTKYSRQRKSAAF